MRIRFLGAALLALAAAPAAPAQIGNNSDPGGIVITGSDVGPSIPSSPRRERGSIFQRDRGAVRFASPEVACAVSTEARRVVEDLQAGRLRAPDGPSAGRAIPAETQAMLASVVTSADSLGVPAAYVDALVSSGARNDVERTAAGILGKALSSLFLRGDGCTEPRTDARPWLDAFDSYENLVDVASPSLVREPSDALLATQAVLARIVAAATAAARVD